VILGHARAILGAVGAAAWGGAPAEFSLARQIAENDPFPARSAAISVLFPRQNYDCIASRERLSVGDREAFALPPGMNVAFFLIPKSQVVWVQASDPLMTALERMTESGYTAVPVLDAEGKCTGVLTEGDIMRVLMDTGAYWRGVFRRTLVLDVNKRRTYLSVSIDAGVETLIARAINQNFVPVVDDREVFIGIVPRKPIIEHCARLGGLLPEPAKSAS